MSFGGIGTIEGPAKTDSYGPVKLANIETTDVLTIAGDNESINENALNDGVVTPAWLNKWRIDNNILSAPANKVFVYVDPLNGMDMTVEQLAADPPGRPNKSVRSLRLAAEYANTVFGPEAVVVYRLGPGPYFESGTGNQNTITFKTVVEFEAYDFVNFRKLNDSTDRGTRPFLQTNGVSNPLLFDNPLNQPTFLTPVSVTRVSGSGVTTITESPFTLSLNRKPLFQE